MAYNHEAPSNGSSPSPRGPSGSPRGCPSTPDASLLPSCSSNCCISGCAATTTTKLCPTCYAECLDEEGLAPRTVSTQKIDLPSVAERPAGASIVAGAAPDVADISALHAVLKSKRPPPSRRSRGIFTLMQPSDAYTSSSRAVKASSSIVDSTLQASHPCEGRIPSPLSLSPRESEGEGGSLTLTSPSQQKAINRCASCRKRLGLLGFKCRCGDLFCASHRYSDKHDCSFDYKAAGRLAIAKENPVVKASKIDRI